MKKSISVFLSLVLVFSILFGMNVNAQAATSGQCGNDVYWSIDTSTGELRITGTGSMYDYPYTDEYGEQHFCPWKGLTCKTAYIESGITSICYEAFANSLIKTIEIPASVTSIGGDAFYNCNSLESVYFLGDSCNISDSKRTFCNYDSTSGPYANRMTFYCSKFSDAYSFALKYGIDYQIPYSQCNHIAEYNKTRGAFYCKLCGSYLFIKNDGSYVCTEHDWEIVEIIESATCTEDGLANYECNVCGETKVDIVEAKGHYYYSTVYTFCEEQGYTAHTCRKCRYSYFDTYTQPLGHIWEVSEVAVEPTCHEYGLTYYHCSRPGCDYQKSEYTDATASYAFIVTPPTCLSQGHTDRVCSACGEMLDRNYEILEATGHNWNEGVLTSPVTCTEYGVITYTCKNCLEERYEYIPNEEGHCYASSVTKEPTKDEYGVKTFTCIKCGDSYTEKIAKLPSGVASSKAETPKKTTISSVKSSKSGVITVKWKKQSSVSGYQIQYSTSKNFKKGCKNITVNNSKKTSSVIKKLKSKKTYYVRVRTYKTVQEIGKTTKVYSKWSSAQSIKTK